jgi:acyl carrier protein
MKSFTLNISMQKIIIEYIEKELLSGQSDLQLSADEDILTTGLIDSIGIMSLITFLEEKFSVTIPAEDMTIENFLTVETIETYIQSLKK